MKICETECNKCEFFKDCKEMLDEEIELKQSVAVVPLVDVEKHKNEHFDITSKFFLFPLLDPIDEDIRKAILIFLKLQYEKRNLRKVNTATLAASLGFTIKEIRQTFIKLKEIGVIEEILYKRVKLQNQIKKKIILSDEKTESIELKDLAYHYQSLFQKKFGVQTKLDGRDFHVLANLKAEFANKSKDILSLYFELEDAFLKKNVYALTLLPTVLKVLRVKLKEKEKKVETGVSKLKLEAYKKGLVEGRWNGDEPWEKPYQELLKQENGNKNKA